jgi:hypothetical protein
MQRRDFLSASLAASALAFAPEAVAQAATTSPREYYLIRRYHLHSGPQTSLTQNYFANALIPALTRMGIGPVGAFQEEIGTDAPAYYLVIPSGSAETLTQLTLRLGDDAAFLKAADPFWNAPATAPAFERVESSLLMAFTGWPKMTPPPASATKGKRIFQLRSYESPSEQAHIRKIEMFHNGEFDYFKDAGFHPVFFADKLFGSRMPSLTYMLSFNGLDEYYTRWDAFRNHPEWKKLSANPRYNYEAIVSNITNLILSPLPASQI